jgi:acyl carrier protein
VTRAELRKIVADVLEIDPGQLKSEADLKEIESFDSVAVLTLLIELDEKAGIKLELSDIRELRYFGDIERLAERQGFSLAD